jgi:hypothetical protein
MLRYTWRELQPLAKNSSHAKGVTGSSLVLPKRHFQQSCPKIAARDETSG